MVAYFCISDRVTGVKSLMEHCRYVLQVKADTKVIPGIKLLNTLCILMVALT